MPSGHGDDSSSQRPTVKEFEYFSMRILNASVQYPEIHHSKMNFPETQKQIGLSLYQPKEFLDESDPASEPSPTNFSHLGKNVRLPQQNYFSTF